MCVCGIEFTSVSTMFRLLFVFIIFLLLNFIEINSLICPDISKLFFFLVIVLSLSSIFYVSLPLWYRQTFHKYILNRRFLLLTYNELLLYYDLLFICLYLWIVFSLVFSLLYWSRIMKLFHRWNHPTIILAILVVLLPNTYQ
jgi:hypothetical protein